MSELGTLSVKISADSAQLEQGVKRSNSALKSLGSTAIAMPAMLAKYAVAAAAAGAAIATALTVKSMKAIDTQAKLARSLDGTVDGLRALQLAAGDAGVDGLDASLSRLNRRLGAAAMGTGPAVNAVQMLNLELNKLQNMDVDQRIAAIADAIKEQGLSSSEAARILQDLGFQQQAATELFLNGGDAIRGYRDEVNELGISLNGIQTARIEAANDAFSRVRTIAERVGNTFAGSFAPGVQLVSDLLVDASKNVGDFSDTTDQAMIRAVGYFGRFLDAIHQARIGFLNLKMNLNDFDAAAYNLFANMVEGFDTVINFFLRGINRVISAYNAIPGLSDLDLLDLRESEVIDSLRAISDEFASTANKAYWDMQDLMDMPAPSEAFQARFDAIKEAAERTAEERAAIEMRSFEFTQGIEEQAAEKTNERLEEQLERMRQAGWDEITSLEEKHLTELEMIEQFLEDKLITQQEYDELLLESIERREDAITAIETRSQNERARQAQENARRRVQSEQQAMNALTSLMNSGSRELFQVGKIASIAQATMNTYQGITNALANVPYPLNIGAAAAIGAAGFAQVANIKAQSFGSGASGGASSVTAGLSAQAQPVQQPQQQQGPAGGTLTVQGLSAASLFSGDAVAQIAEELLDYQRRGGAVLIQG